jgi:hypothetical protein
VNRSAVVAIALLVALGIAPRQGESTPADDSHTGDLLQTLNLGGTVADCSTTNVGKGTSLALVQGSKVGYSNPVLLVTSCLANGSGGATKRASLYFIDPGTGTVVNAASPLKTMLGTTVDAPGDGWAQLVAAPDRGLLYGCGTNGALYSIDYIVNSLQAVAVTDGTTSQVLTKPAAITTCTGLAWDPSNKTIYQSTSGNTIFHFDPKTGSPPPATPASFSAPLGCNISGLSVVGGVLLVACNGTQTVYRLDKSSGTQLADHTTMTFKGNPVADLECDPVSFSGSGFSTTRKNTDAAWSKIPATQQVQAFWVPPGTCGLPPTETVFAPAACPDSPPIGSSYTAYRNADGSPIDGDGDGLWNCWKDPKRWNDNLPGIGFDGGATGDPTKRDVTLCTVDSNLDGVADTDCATPGGKHILVEIDYLQGFKPDAQALLNVQTAFLNAPGGPIFLHFLVDEQIPYTPLTVAPLVSLEPCTAPATATNGAWDFDLVKSGPAPGGGPAAGWFGTAAERSNGKPHTTSAKRFAFKYMLFGRNLVSPSSSGAGNTGSGCSEVPGDDSVITMGSFTGGVGTTDEQAGTVMHELGHNLGLRHGGRDNTNCKPNYLSVMSYSRQFADYITLRRLDYSRDELPLPSPNNVLNENALVENNGIGTPSITKFPASQLEKTVFGVASLTGNKVVSLAVGTSAIPTPLTPIDWDNEGTAGGETVSGDINKLPAKGQSEGCPLASTGQSLVGFNDWANLQFNARASLDFAGGSHTDDVHPTNADKSAEGAQFSFESGDLDGDGVEDAFACGTDILAPAFQPDPNPQFFQLTPCAIDVKPGTTPKVLSKQGDSNNVSVAILSTLSFDATSQVVYKVVNPQMFLNDKQVRLNKNQEGTCLNRDVNGDGLKDLVCQFSSANLPLGRNYATLEFQVMTAQCTNPAFPVCNARGHQVITVVK